MFGKTPRGLHLDSVIDEDLGKKAAQLTDAEFQRRLERKRICREAYIAEQATDQEARAILRKRRCLQEWKTGTLVWYWREPGANPAGKKHAGRAGAAAGHASGKGGFYGPCPWLL